MKLIKWLILHKLQKVVVFGFFACLWFGCWGTWNALRHRTPTAVPLASGPLSGVPDYLTLQKIQLSAADAVVVEYHGHRQLHIPIRPQGAPPTTLPFVFLRTEHSDWLSAAGPVDLPVGQVAARVTAPRPELAKLTARTELTGMIASEFTVSPKIERELRAMFRGLGDFKVVVEGEKPSLARALWCFAGAFVLMFVMAAMAPNEKPATAPPPLPGAPPPLVAEPPILPQPVGVPAAKSSASPKVKGRPWGQPPA